MHKPVCRVCLRSDFSSSGVIEDTVVEFHNVLCDSEAYSDIQLSFCPICAHLLRKFYEFQEKCKEAHLVLKGLRNHKVPLHKLLKHAPPSPFGFCQPSSRQKVYDIIAYKKSNDPLTTFPIKIKTIDSIEKKSKSDQNKNSLIHNEEICDTEIKTEIETEGNNEEMGEVEYLDDEFYDENNVKSDEESVNDDGSKNDEGSKNYDGSIGDDLNWLDSDFDEEDKLFIKKILTPPEKPTETLDHFSTGSNKFMSTIKKRTLDMKRNLMDLLKKGAFNDLPEKIDKDMLLRMFKRCSLTFLKAKIPDKNDPKYHKFMRIALLRLIKRYHPKYESVFDITPLTTLAAARAEMAARKESEHYLKAKYRCDICYRVFDTEQYLKNHNLWHDPSLPFACELCGMRYATRLLWRRHRYSGHSEVYRCRKCPLVTTAYSAMQDHYLRHMKITIKCPDCHKEFSARSSYYFHRTTHRESCHVCLFCAKRCVSLPGLNIHMKRVHQGVKTPTVLVKCQMCDAKFVSNEILTLHMRDFHELKFKRRVPGSVQSPKVAASFLTCQHCGEDVPSARAGTRAMLAHHRRAHPGVPYVSRNARFLCEHCGRGYQFRAFYTDHLNTHTGARPYACAQCDARFASNAQRLLHTKREHEKRKYRCPICDKMFKYSSSLNKHKQLHFQDRRLKCELCSKDFSDRSALRNHVRGVHQRIRKGDRQLNNATLNKPAAKLHKLTYKQFSGEE